MLRFLASRLGTAVIVLFVLTLIVFVLSRVIPADPAVVYAGPKAPPEELARIREKLGFDQPLIVQYHRLPRRARHRRLGRLARHEAPRARRTRHSTAGDPRADLRGHADRGRLRHRARGRRRQAAGQALDGAIRFLVDRRHLDAGVLARTSCCRSLFVGQLKLLPATGQFSTEVEYIAPITPVTGFPLFDSLITGNWVASSDGLAHLILPAITLAAYPLGLIARMTRASMLEVLGQDYVFTAEPTDCATS